MQLKPLGSSGIEVSVVGLGCMNFGMMCDQQATTEIVDAAIDSGVNFFDVADIYGGPHGKAEELLGKALGARRQDIVLATKFGAKQGGGGGAAPGGGSRDYIMSCRREQSAAAGHGLHRPVPASFPRFGNAGRGNAARAGRPRSAGQGAGDRLQQLHRRDAG